MKNIILLIVVLMAIFLTGCYTSFVPREYEENSYGQMDKYYNSDDVANADSSEFYYREKGYYYDEPDNGVTIINNYSTDWGWGYNSPFYSRIYTSYGCYDPFYDPFYDPYCYPSYKPYYGGNIYVYGNVYNGYGYGYNYNYSPSSIRYRTNRRHWTSLRNNGGRAVVTRSRNVNRRGDSGIYNRSKFRTAKGFNLDRDLTVSKSTGYSRIAKSRGLRTANYTRDRNNRTKVKRSSDIERRRISRGYNSDEIIRNSKVLNRERVSRKSRVVKNSKRSQRVYSSKRASRNNSRTSSRTYYKPPSSSRSSSSNVSNSSRRKSSNSSGYSSSRSSSSNSSSYSSSRNTSRSSSSRSSVSRPSSNRSSRSSVSRSASRSSSRSSGSSRRTSRSSKRRR